MKEKLSSIKTKISKEYFDIKMFFKEKGNKYQVLFSIFGVLLSVIGVVGVSYSAWSKTAYTGNNSISTGTITMRYIEDTSAASFESSDPTTASSAYQSNNYFPFQVAMTSSTSATLDYEITVTTQNTTTLSDDTEQKVRIGLKKENVIVTDAGFSFEGSNTPIDYTNGVIIGTLPATGTDLNGNTQTIYKGTITSNGTETIHNFKLYLWQDINAIMSDEDEKYVLTVNVNTGDSTPMYGNYTLTYVDNIGLGCNSLTKTVRKRMPWGELCNPQISGEYHFGGWYTGQNGTGTKVTSTTSATSNQNVYAYYNNNTLYAVLKNAAIEGTYAKQYTGNLQDSMNSSLSTETIYHWYGSNASDGTAILDKNNVIFAGQCWQVIRTTDTGGIRMIYNGEAVNNKCLSTRSTHIGYTTQGSMTQSLNGTYWYGTDYTYNSSTNKFSISGTISSVQVTSSNGSTVIPTLVGKYTCKSTSESGTCSPLYLIRSYNSSYYANIISLKSGSHYSQFGESYFNVYSTSPAYVGYMYNKIYQSNSKNYLTESMFTSYSLSTAYYYADSYDYNETTANKYTLTNPYKVSSTSDYPSLVGKYTLLSATDTYSSASAYYIAGVSGSTMYVMQLSGGHDLAYYNDTYTYGTSYTDNGNGTYTINNPTTINRIDYYANSDYLSNKYVCKNAINDTCNEIWRIYIGVAKELRYYKSANLYKYASDFTYNSSTGKYTLNSDTVTFWDTLDVNNIASLNTHHYTCFDTTGTCATLSYINGGGDGVLYYMNLTGGKDVDDILEEMLLSNDVNKVDSTIKLGIEAWYKKYILPYDSYVDDTIYCSDRTIIALGGFNPDGGIVYSIDSSIVDLRLKSYAFGTDLSCSNLTDKFSVSNDRAQLTYKVGLMSLQEMNLLNQSNARKTGSEYWLLSPFGFRNSSSQSTAVGTTGIWSITYPSNYHGVRPAISLISGAEYISGDGSMANPYLINTN